MSRARILRFLLIAGTALAAGMLAPRVGILALPVAVAIPGALWVVSDPDRALLAYLVALPLSSAFVVLTGMELAKYVFAALLLAWIPTLRRPRRIVTTDIPFWGLVFVGWCVTSALGSRSVSTAIGNAVRLLGYVLFVTIASERFANRATLVRSLVAILVPSVPLAALGISQFLTKSTILGLGLHPATGQFVTWKGYVQASGVFDHPNVFATYMFVYLCLAIGLLLHARGFLLRGLLLVCALASFAGLIVSFSRSGWIGTMAAAAVFVLLRPRFLALALTLGAVLLVLVLVLPREQVEGLTRRTTFEMDASMLARLGAYKTGWRMFTQNPVLGVGLGGFYRRFLDYKVPDARFPKNYIRGSESGMEAHSTYLQFLAETGIVGLALFLAFNLAVLRQILLLLQKGGSRLERGLATGCAGAFAALVVQNGLNSQEYLKAFWLVVALVAGLGHRSEDGPDRQTTEGQQEVVRAARGDGLHESADAGEEE